GMVCVVGWMRDLILQLSKSSIYSTKASDAAKKDMNIVYQKIYKIIKARGIPDITSKFETAQKNWIASRENWWDVQGLIIGSPMYSVCRMDMNISRVNELNDLLEQIQN
ncbi:lysozyme inhibitor LprI family protein, partial [Klebsiella pneumoniae]